jgi:hypothetical protein
MFKFMIAFVLTFGLLVVGFSTPASANGGERCESSSQCTNSEYVSICEHGTCRSGYCVYEPDAAISCVAEYDSRGDCISTNKDRCQEYFPNREDRKNCNAAVKDFCDCAVDAGCTDKPNGPPEEE